MEVVKFAPKNGQTVNPKHRFDNALAEEWAFFAQREDGTIYPVLTVRLYWPGKSGDSPCYACAWLRPDGADHWGASDRATGYGYDKKSSAFAYALNKMGFEFDKGIAGVGSSAMEAAGRAVLAHFGLECALVHTAHA